MKKLSRLCCLLHIFSAFTVFGQKSDTTILKTDSTQVSYFYLNKNILLGEFVGSETIDTNLYNFQHYDPLRKKYVFFAGLGNTGLAGKSMVYSENTEIPFSYGIHSFDAYKFSHQNVKFYNSLLPFTELYYVLGMKREQLFRVTHYHHVRNKVHLGVEYQIINSPGRENFSQKSNNHALSVFTYYQTKNKKYGVLLNYIYNRIRVLENGGITDDTAYINYRKGDRASFFDINLRYAENKNKESSVELVQYFVNSGDTNTSKASEMKAKSINIGRFFHTFTLSKETFRYSDKNPNLDFYPDIENDSGVINDSVWYFTIKNSLGWTNTEFNKNNLMRKVRYYALVKHTYCEVHQLNKNFYLNILSTTAGFMVKPFTNFSFEASVDYNFEGDYKDNFSLNAMILYHFLFHQNDYGKLKFSINFSETDPPFFYEHFYSKFFAWDNDLKKQENFYAGINYSISNLSVGFDFNQIQNYTYLSGNYSPRQNSERIIKIYSFYAKKLFMIRKFGIDNHLVLQNTNAPNSIRLPLLAAQQSYFFITPLFKKAMLLQAGVDVFYNTKYYSYAYQPVLMSFCLQNQRKTGNYLNLDVFINLKVKRMRMFFKLSNLLSGWVGYDNFTVLHYPMQDRLFRFGISWIFHD